jgi:hypothetical protein
MSPNRNDGLSKNYGGEREWRSPCRKARDYNLVYERQVCIVENVPSRVDKETFEQFFAPAPMDRLHEVIHMKPWPDSVVETPV